MERIKNPKAILSTVLRIVFPGVLLFHLLFLALNVRAQSVLQVATAQPKYPMVESKRTTVRNIYTSQIGVRETKPNSGPEVEKYLRYVGLPKGNPWCAAFVCWALGEAGVGNPRSGWSPALFADMRIIWVRGEQRTKSKEQGFPQSAKGEPGTKNQESRFGEGSPDGYAYSLAAGKGQSITPKAGDVFGLYFPEKGRIAHVGFVDEWLDPWVITVEGNTNVLGSREGDGVYRKRRIVRSINKVASYVK